MSRVLRAIGVAVLVTATLHASAGLCLCHGGGSSPASTSGSHRCCLPAEDSGRAVVGGVPTCCHIEAAQRDMTPVSAVQLAPPPTVAVAHVSGPATGRIAIIPVTLAAAPSPPIQVLRV